MLYKVKICNPMFGVPPSFILHHNLSQFEVIGCPDYTGRYGSDETGIGRIGEEWISAYRREGGRGHYTPNMTSLVYYDTDGKAKTTFKRIIIRSRFNS